MTTSASFPRQTLHRHQATLNTDGTEKERVRNLPELTGTYKNKRERIGTNRNEQERTGTNWNEQERTENRNEQERKGTTGTTYKGPTYKFQRNIFQESKEHPQESKEQQERSNKPKRNGKGQDLKGILQDWNGTTLRIKGSTRTSYEGTSYGFQRDSLKN